MRASALVVSCVILAVFLPSCNNHTKPKRTSSTDLDFEKEHARVLQSRIKSIREYRCRINRTAALETLVIISEKRYGANGYQTEEYHYDYSGALSYREELTFDQEGTFLQATDYDTNGRFSFRRLRIYDEHANEARYYSSRRRLEDSTLDQIDMYDRQGNIVHQTSFNSDGSIGSAHDLSYDSLGRLAVEKDFDSDGSIRGTTKSTYDSDGNKIRELYSDPLDTPKATISWQYDLKKRLIVEVNGDVGNRTEYTYDDKGHLVKAIQFGNGLSSNTTSITYEYVSRGNKAKEIWINDTEKVISRIIVYEYEYFSDK